LVGIFEACVQQAKAALHAARRGAGAVVGAMPAVQAACWGLALPTPLQAIVFWWWVTSSAAKGLVRLCWFVARLFWQAACWW
jgi:hypothetical protein